MTSRRALLVGVCAVLVIGAAVAVVLNLQSAQPPAKHPPPHTLSAMVAAEPPVSATVAATTMSMVGARSATLSVLVSASQGLLAAPNQSGCDAALRTVSAKGTPDDFLSLAALIPDPTEADFVEDLVNNVTATLHQCAQTGHVSPGTLRQLRLSVNAVHDRLADDEHPR